MKNRTEKKRGIRSLSYMTVSIGLFLVSLAITVFLLVRSALTAGGLGKAEGVLGILALAAGVIGFIAPLYGHFIVRIDGRGDWRVGAVLNGLMTLLLTFLYFLGIQ